MQVVPNADKALLDAYAMVTLAVYIDGEEICAGIGDCTATASCGCVEEFGFGNACAAGLEIKVAAALPTIKEHRINVTWSVGTAEYPLLTGKVDSAIVSAGQTTIKVWDDMYYSGSDAFVVDPSLCEDCDAAVAFRAVAESMGVNPEPATLEKLSGVVISGGLNDLPEDVSNSAVAGYIAGLLGGNAQMTREGLLAVRCFTDAGWSTEPYSGGASAENEDYNVTGVTLQREKTVETEQSDGSVESDTYTEEYTSGDGTLMLENPLADQSAADRTYEALQALAVRPGEYSFPGGLLLEPGDVFTVESMDGTYRVAVTRITMSFDGGVKTTVSCAGPPETDGFEGTINQALKTLFADYAVLRKLVVENAEIFNAKINHLTVDDIVAGKIRSTDFEAIDLEPIYPLDTLYPSGTLFPNNGEEIIRGIEIDFETGIIRGTLFGGSGDGDSDLAARVAALEKKVGSGIAVAGGVSITSDGEGNVAITAGGDATIISDGDGNITIA